LRRLALALSVLFAAVGCSQQAEPAAEPVAEVAAESATEPASAAAAGPEAEASVDPAAVAGLRRMTDYLASLPEFSLDTSSTLDVVLHSGQKIKFNSANTLTLQRPNKFHAKRYGDLVMQDFYYDGTNLTMSNPESLVYAVVPAPPTIDETLDFIVNELDIVAPASDLLHADAIARLTGEATSGMVVGQSVIEGKVCDHLAFRSPDVDIQVWMEAGDKPAPCKYTITTTDMAGMPEFSITVRSFDAAPKIADGLFQFTPLPGATQIDVLKN
jgi:hypothetical protein